MRRPLLFGIVFGLFALGCSQPASDVPPAVEPIATATESAAASAAPADAVVASADVKQALSGEAPPADASYPELPPTPEPPPPARVAEADVRRPIEIVQRLEPLEAQLLAELNASEPPNMVFAEPLPNLLDVAPGGIPGGAGPTVARSGGGLAAVGASGELRAGNNIGTGDAGNSSAGNDATAKTTATTAMTVKSLGGTAFASATVTDLEKALRDAGCVDLKRLDSPTPDGKQQALLGASCDDINVTVTFVPHDGTPLSDSARDLIRRHGAFAEADGVFLGITTDDKNQPAARRLLRRITKR